MKGIETYVTESGIRVMRLHYSADPRKDPDTERGQKWLQAQLKGYDGGIAGADWQQEMEINFRIKSGKKVFPDWEVKYQPRVTYDPEAVEIEEHWPLYAGFDFGVSNPTVFTVHAFESMERAYQIDEVVATGEDAAVATFAQRLRRKPYWDRIRGIVGDPSIWNRNQMANEAYLTSIGDMYAEHGVMIQKGRKDVGVDMTFVTLLRGYLWQDLDNPKWLISRECQRTIRCFRNLRKIVNKSQDAIDNKANPETIVGKNVDEFDSCKYILLAVGFEDPESIEELPGTFEWHVQQLESEKQMYANVLR